MPISRITLARVAAGGVLLLLAGAASAAPYPDTVGEQAGTNNPEVDITGVEVTRDLANVNFRINLNADISVANFGNYLIGIQTGPGGSTELNNPWGKPIGISTGMNLWVGSWVDFGGGAQVYGWTGSEWIQMGGTIAPALAPNSTTLSIPLSLLGLANGNTFKFDVWSTYGSPGGQSAYDALNNPQTTVAEPWNGTPYDSATLGGPLASLTVLDGDADSDSTVGFTDLVALAQNYGSAAGSTWAQGDFNGDGQVGFEDLVILAQNYGRPAVGASTAFSAEFMREWATASEIAGVPEPSLTAMGLLALPMALIRRRRK